jgi:hypothetical protein
MEERREDEPKAYYLSRSYQMHIKDKYNIMNNSLLYDDKLCLMLYAREWFNIPKEMSYMKIILHPYLTIRDDKLLKDMNKNNNRSLIFYFLGNLALMNILGQRIKRSKTKLALRFLFTLGLCAVSTYLYKTYYLNLKFEETLKEDKNLNKYLKLDLDYNKIKADLSNYGIVVK